jgi:hypothetical protein
MTELERALLRLGEQLAFPEAPDVSRRVLDALAAAPAPPRRSFNRRVAVLALAVLAVAIGAAMAVPQARTAILDFFGLRGATVQRVETLPTVPTTTEPALFLGKRVSLENGHPRVKIPGVVVPTALGPPDAAYVSEESYGQRLTLVYEPGDGVPESQYTGVGILVSEFVGKPYPGYVEKMVDSGTTVARVKVGPHRALWLEGGPHAVLFRTDGDLTFDDRGRLAGNTLLVEDGDLLVRIEGEISRERAIEIAKSLAP